MCMKSKAQNDFTILLFCHLDLEKNITRMENFTSGHVMYPRHFDHMSEGSQVSWGVIWQVFFSYVNS